MKRKTALKKLQACIPSFNFEYKRWGEKVVDKDKDHSWLYRDECYRRPDADWKEEPPTLPEVIPPDFLIGEEAVIGDEKYVVRRDPDDTIRKVCLEVTDFAAYGNTHKYGKLKIRGVHWGRVNDDGLYSWTSSRQLGNVDPRVTGLWDVDLYWIIRDSSYFGEGEIGYEVNEATARFVSRDELYITAAYVAILRVGGPMLLHDGYSAAAFPEKYWLVKIDENDNVTLSPRLRKMMKYFNENGEFER